LKNIKQNDEYGAFRTESGFLFAISLNGESEMANGKDVFSISSRKAPSMTNKAWKKEELRITQITY